MGSLSNNTLSKFIQIFRLSVEVSAPSGRHLHDQWELIELQVVEFVGVLVDFVLEVAQVKLRVEKAHIISE